MLMDMGKLLDKGISSLTVLIIVAVVAVLGLAGYIWHSKQSGHKQNTASTVHVDISGKPTATSSTFAAIPATWTEYRNDQLGFRFGYPAEWGTIQSTDPGPGYKLLAYTNNYTNGDTNINGQINLTVQPASSYTLTQKYSVTIKPASNSTGWQITDVNPSAANQYKVGQAYTLQTKHTVNGGIAYVASYNDEGCTQTIFVMPIKGNFVELDVPELCAPDTTTTVSTVNQLAYNSIIDAITKSITLY
jgi:hypothetical protein